MTSLTDRYLAATLRSVPTARRAEISAELRGSIEDMIEDREGNGRDPATAEREVLTELGAPEQLAARYADRRLQLIGPTYYLVWLRLLRLLLAIVPAVAGAVDAVVAAADGKTVGGAIGSGIGTAIEVGVHIAFWLTLVFAIVERTGTALNLREWSVDQLPEAPVERDFSIAGAVASVVWLVAVIAFLPGQHVRPWLEGDGGTRIPVIDPALWTSWLPVIIAVLAASAVFEIVKYRSGRWTWPLVAVNGVLHLAFALPVAWLLLTDRLFNPAFVQHFDGLREGDDLRTGATIGAVVLVVILVWDVVDSVLKTRRRTA